MTYQVMIQGDTVSKFELPKATDSEPTIRIVAPDTETISVLELLLSVIPTSDPGVQGALYYDSSDGHFKVNLSPPEG